MKIISILIFIFFYTNYCLSQADTTKYILKKTITGGLTPKSVIYAGKGLYFAQNMMYKHTIQVYDSLYNLITTISDNVSPSEFGYSEIKGRLKGAPVEAAATADGKYVWVSNYNMVGEDFTKPGCDTCCCSGYDDSFVYKINTETFRIDNIVKVGSVPKYLAITPNQQQLLVSNWSSGDISIIDLNTEKEIKRIKVGRQPRGIVCNNESTTAYIAVMGAHYISKINLENLESEKFISPGKNPRHLCMDDNYLYVSLNGEQSVARINLQSYILDKIKVGSMPRSMTLSSKSGKLFVNCYGDAKIAVINTKSFQPETTFFTNKNPIGIALSPDDKEVWVACYSGSLQVFTIPKISEPGLLASINDIKNEMFTIIENTVHTVSKSVVNTDKNSEEKTIKKADLKEVKKTTIIIETHAETASPTRGYYIVLGSFKIKENANKLKKQMLDKGIDSKILYTDKGLTYCAVGIYAGKDEAQQSIAEIEQKSGIKGWVYYQN